MVNEFTQSCLKIYAGTR